MSRFIRLGCLTPMRTRSILACLLLSLLGCHEDFMALDQDAGPDAGRQDAMPPVDLGPPIPQVTVAPLVAGGGEALGVGWFLIADEAGEDEYVYTAGLSEVLQPSGPDLVDLPGSHAVTGVRAVGTEAFTWIAHSDELDVQGLEGGEDFLWLHFLSAEPRGVNGTTTMGPKLMRLFYDGTIDMEVPVPAAVQFSFVGEDSAGDRWLLGAGTGPVVIDGTSLGDTGQTIRYLTRLTPTGLVDPVLLATGGAVINPFTSARLLADGDLLAAVYVESSGGTVAGETMIPNSTSLLKIDLEGPTIVDQWTSTRFMDVYETETGVELHTQVTSSSIRIGDHDYAQIGDALTHVRVAWDPVTESDIPEGERWPVVPEEVRDGLHVGSSSTFGPVEIFTVLDDDHSIVRRMKTDAQVLERSVRWDGGVFTGVLIEEGGTAELIVEGDAAGTHTLDEVVAGNQSFWVLQLDTATGEVVRRKGYDAGLTGVEARVHAQPLTEDLFLVAIWTEGGATALMLDGWELSEPIDIPVSTTGAECQAWPSGRSVSFPRVVTFEPAAFGLTARCDGAHTVSVGDASFELGTDQSVSVFRVQVD